MRLLRHLFAPSAHRKFPPESLARIAQAIAESETRHCGEICFAVESALPLRAVLAGAHPRQRALDAFAQLRVWDTQANNGVLVYLLLADRDIEIIADRGLDGRISAEQWQQACSLIEAHMKNDAPEAAILAGIEAVGALLAEHDPRSADSVADNELPDLPRILR